MRGLLAALFLGLLAAGCATAPAEARWLSVGMADDAALLQGGPDADKAVADWRDLGIDTVRIQVSWARVAPAPESVVPPAGFQPAEPDDPGYHWGVIDAAVHRLVAAGIEPMLMLDGPAPLWGSGRPNLGNERYRVSAPAFANFATAVARRYGDVVDKYILWNEPNLPLWLQPQAACGKRSCTPIAPNTYRGMVRAAYPAVHAADPVATVLIGALAPAGGDLKSENANMRPLEFLRALGCVDKDLQPIARGGCAGFQPALADGFSYHPHSTRHAPSQPYEHPDNADLGSLRKLEKLLDRLQALGRLQASTTPINLWLDEYGYQTNPPDRLRGVSPGAQDRYLQEAAYLAWRDPRVQLLAQYLYTDEPVAGGRRYTGWQSGLRFADGKPKAALDHFDDPIWVDVPRGLVWGQIRPGFAHDVVVERRLPGSATDWVPIAQTTTGPDGSWLVPTSAVPFASYRAVTDDGRTSGAIVAVPPGEAAPDAPGSAAGGTVERRIVGTVPAAAVPRSFAGFSLEYWTAKSYLGSTHVNPIFARLVGELARTGNGAPTLRLGGNSTDEAWWNPAAVPRPPGIWIDQTPPALRLLRAWTVQTGTPLMLGVNLALNDPGNAAGYAQALTQTLPPGSIAALEVGNEPDLYTRPRTFKVGARQLARGLRRATDYDYPQYRAELSTFRSAIAAVAPTTPISAGGFATSAWEDTQGDLLEQPGPAPLSFSAHTYALHTCDRSRRRAASYARALLGSNAFTPPVTRMQQLAAVAAAHGASFRVSEANSANCGGVRGASDTFASALWGTDLLFGLAAAGVRNVNFHTFKGAFYAPVDFVLRKGHVVGRVHPLFYAMLLFNRATPAGSRLLPVGPGAPGAPLKTWATVDAAGTRRIVVLNKDVAHPRRVVLQVPGAKNRARVTRLVAPSVYSKNGVTFGGLGYGEATSDGELKGKAKTERTERRRGAFRVDMPAGSAALITVRAG